MGVENPKVKPPKKSAAGVPAVTHALEYSLDQTSAGADRDNCWPSIR